jgi:hypothetical protein
MLKYSIAALAIVASSTFALADPNNGGPGGGGSMEHSGGAMKGGSTEGNGGPSGKMGGGKSEHSSAGEERSGSMGKSMSSGEKSGKSGMADHKQANEEKSRNDEKGKSGERNKQANDNDRSMKNDQRNDRAERNDQKDRKNADQVRDNSRPEKSATGAGEGAEGKARPKGELSGINSEQKTKVISAFSGHRVAPARDIGVAVNVGVVIPRSVHFYPIPEEIVTIVPDYRTYQYFMIDDSHVAIVDPDSLEVVDIIVIA